MAPVKPATTHAEVSVGTGAMGMGKRTDEAATESSPVGGRQLRRFSAVTIAHDRALSGASGQLYLTQREGAGPATRVGRAGATHEDTLGSP